MTYIKKYKLLVTSAILFISTSFVLPTTHAATPLQISTSTILSDAKNLRPEVLALALKAYNNAIQNGVGVNNPLLTVIDYSRHSDEKRLWVIDLRSSHVIMNLLVAHGKNSGRMDAKHFSNSPQSRETSLGLFVTEGTYMGHNGLSLRLKGLDKGFNNNAESRAIVVHGAPYVSDAFAKQYGRVGNSWGCPAVDRQYAPKLINTIKGGSLIFSYYPDANLLLHSQYLQA
ncbi:MAG: hypothetical protein CL816_03545 [Coxiellaceae bacterium]|nr:hypothetical protein [Coxiellaceae bacterium]|tara:strand:+ start:2386 stop:3072 length:687 start_codon:yes stop_codon:yes gene_type:complete